MDTPLMHICVFASVRGVQECFYDTSIRLFFYFVQTSFVRQKASSLWIRVDHCETDSKPKCYFLISHAGVLLPPIVLS